MKCKYCDGTGTSNWCINGIFQPCEYCNGTGEVEVVGDSVIDVCDKCGGTGVIESLTNEERFCQLSTKEKAIILFRLCNRASIFGAATSEEYEAWLKEKH